MSSASCTPSFARFHLGDVVEAAEAAGDVARRQRLAFERGDDADDVDDAVGRDHDDAELVGREPERLGDEHPALRLVDASSGDTGRP